MDRLRCDRLNRYKGLAFGVGGFAAGVSGAIMLDGQSITKLGPEQIAARGLARTFQHGRVFANLSVLENVLARTHGCGQFGQPSRCWGRWLSWFWRSGGRDQCVRRSARCARRRWRSWRCSASGGCRASISWPTVIRTPTGGG
jgi:hypothetical protein